ncbi:MAG: hypothetical protein Q7T61_20020 [Caulobacter sp.]|nr:hypothetical protein [Caulobacter sp.]
MSDGGGPLPPNSVTAEAVIVGAEMAAGHDGQAELAVRILYPNGVVGVVLLDAATGYALMNSCNIDSLEGLRGQSWRKILEGIDPCTTS